MSKSQIRRCSLGCDFIVHSSEFQMHLANKQDVERRAKRRSKSAKRRNDNNRIFGSKNVAAFFPFLCLTLWLNSYCHSGVHSAPVEKHGPQLFGWEVPGIGNGIKGKIKRYYRNDDHTKDRGMSVFKQIGKCNSLYEYERATNILYKSLMFIIQ